MRTSVPLQRSAPSDAALGAGKKSYFTDSLKARVPEGTLLITQRNLGQREIIMGGRLVVQLLEAMSQVDPDTQERLPQTSSTLRSMNGADVVADVRIATREESDAVGIARRLDPIIPHCPVIACNWPRRLSPVAFLLANR